MIILVVLRN